MPHEFIDITNASFNTLNQSKRLWVVDKIPFKIKTEQENVTENIVAIAQAKIRDNFYRLEKKWLESLLVESIPRNAEKRARLTYNYTKNVLNNLVFIVNDAHLLSASNLANMRLLPEKNITVFLEGDVSIIDIKTRKHPSFCQRALFGVHAFKITTP